ncbi:hypothetical protein HJ588_12530 [Flexivirga sp. ID2601S]|uniref:Polysaccharide biosynthesis protein C-terminal domain-containing protein n=1 Tax=Flexivirga aerilata TaxID=1656889 RepID=A0A849AI72_9MICO|nr:polysaccharide biosynthesis C-terminal domain-containing protein [Flexivirga aerilata]NNG40089.1 hypothetical protein [Flexivirga aerilata]
MSLPSEPPAVDGADLQRGAVAGVSWTMLNTFVGVPVATVVNVVLAHLLAVPGYARLAYLTAALSLVVSLVDLGTTSAMVQFGARAHAAGDVERVQALLTRTQGFRLLVTAPVLSVFMLLAIDLDGWAMAGALVFAVWVPSAAAGLSDCLTLENKTATEAKVVLGVNLLAQIGVVLCAAVTRDADLTWIVRAAITALVPVLAVVFVAPRYRHAVWRPRLPVGFPDGYWHFALPTAAAGLVAGLVTSRSEVLLLEWLSTPVAVGVFALAFGIAGQMYAPANALTGPLLPALAGLRTVAPQRMGAALLRVLRVTSTASAVLCLIAAAPIAVLIPTIYGSDFADAAPIFVALSLSSTVAVIAGPLTAFSLARGHATEQFWLSLVALVVDLALSVALIPAYGAWGAVIAASAAVLLRTALLLRVELPGLGLSGRQALGAVRYLLAPVVAVPLIWWAAGTLPAAPWLVAIASAVVGAAVCPVAVHLLRAGLGADDRQVLLRHVPDRANSIARRLTGLLVAPR